MKRIISLCLVLLLSPLAFAQIQFEHMTHDFGTIEEGVQATHTFTFRNVGKTDQQLHNVRASCGCTTPNWTRGIIKPGQTGTIDVTYNSQGRPGPFTKSITVTHDTTKGAAPIILTIKGDVKKKEAGPGGANTTSPDGSAMAPAMMSQPSINFENTQGNLQIEKKMIQAGLVYSDKPANFPFRIRNNGTSPLQLKGLTTDTEPIYSLKWDKTTLAPGEETNGTVSMDMSKADASGLKNKTTFTNILSFQTDDSQQPVKTVDITGTYNRVYTEAELAQMAKIEFTELEFDGGDIITGDKLEHTFVFKNTGKADLVLESVKASCGCTTPSYTQEAIKPGQTGKIDVRFDSSGKNGPQHKTVMVRSNDPGKDTVVLHIKCNVKEDPFGAKPANSPVASPATPQGY